MKQPRTLILVLILCAFGLRVFRLDAQSLWYDEGVTVNVAQRSLGELTRWTANDIQPPLYYYVVAGWGRLAGWSEWSLRFPSAAFGLLVAPLLAVLLRRGGATPAGVGWGLALAALHPLLLYYSQEARMYTLLLALGVLAGYWVLTLATTAPIRRPLVGYILTATAAVYTHYFAFFLLLALALWLLWSTPHKRPVARAFLAANAVVGLLYLPWFGILLTRLAVDRSYWQGALKLGEALQQIVISFSLGASMQENTALWLLIPIGAITGYRLLTWPRANSHLLTLALLWLVIPLAGVLVLASFAPKFNPRYVLMALPGLLILWSGGQARGAGGEGRLTAPLLRTAPLLVLVLLFGWSAGNWFFDRAFTKDQWREVAAFLRPRLEPQEALVLVSGHAWPVWAYYAPDLPVVRLPPIDVLDVEAVVTFANSAAPLQAAFAANTGKSGAWLIEWQDEVVDPTGIAPVQLELGGREKGSSATFWGVKLRRFSRIRPERIAREPPITQVNGVDFGGQLRLVGHHVMENGDLLLFWQRLAQDEALAADYRITGQTLTVAGVPLARIPDQRPAAYLYPVARWAVGELVMGQIPAHQWLGPTPAVGTYLFQLGVYVVAGDAVTPLTTADGQATLDLTMTITEFD